MSVADILQPGDPTNSLVRFVLGIYNGVIEGDARAVRERISAYRAYISLVGATDPEKIKLALLEAVDAGVIPPPLINKGTIITGRFSAQTEWKAETGGGISLGVGAVALNINASASYGRQQAESSEFTVHLQPSGDDKAFSALAAMHTDANKKKALPPEGGQPPE